MPPMPAMPEPEPEPDDVVGSALSRAEVERVLDDLVRPALQSDGGDIELVDLVGGEVHVRLVGSCSSCPSSLVTMKMGVERLLGEELEGFERLVQVD
jgi:Fe-S cluster biogenesis protein NfuA